MHARTQQAVSCSHCGTAITGNRFVQKGEDVYLDEECYFRDTYLDGILDRIEASYIATIEAFAAAVDAREHGTGDHSLRVTRLAVILGNACGLQGRDLVDLYCGALLHDVGKIGVPDSVLLKRGPLTPQEEEVMRRHPEIGFRIIGHIGYLSKAAEIIRSHHEHYDGSGYPRRLRGQEIPWGARIFAVADALDALTVERPYRGALSPAEALAEIGKASGSVFDPSVVAAVRVVSAELGEFIGKVPDR